MELKNVEVLIHCHQRFLLTAYVMNQRNKLSWVQMLHARVGPRTLCVPPFPPADNQALDIDWIWWFVATRSLPVYPATTSTSKLRALEVVITGYSSFSLHNMHKVFNFPVAKIDVNKCFGICNPISGPTAKQVLLLCHFNTLHVSLSRFFKHVCSWDPKNYHMEGEEAQTAVFVWAIHLENSTLIEHLTAFFTRLVSVRNCGLNMRRINISQATQLLL